MGSFSEECKSAPGYLDIAANGNGTEKAALTVEGLRRLDSQGAHILEIGPGGGAAVDSLTRRLGGEEASDSNLTLSLVEVEAVHSEALDQARKRFEAKLGRTALYQANARDLSTCFDPDSVDIVGASAVLHEVYSYSDGYRGLHDSMRSISKVIRPGGYFAFRDVYAVDAPTLHERTIQTYSPQSWLRFTRMFTPHYLQEGTHPYHHNEDELTFRQDSRMVDVRNIDTSTDAVATGPVGIFREIQRHYITFRDHAWRSGALGFKPILEGPATNDWLDIKRGHKRVHYELTDSELLTENQKTLLLGMSEKRDDSYVIDGDVFDEVTDTALNIFLAEAEKGDTECAEIWEEWLTREGRETYAYMTLDQLLGTMALKSIEADDCSETILLPEMPQDVSRAPRSYYNRFLRSRLSNPLYDGKQLILFRKTPLKETEKVKQSLEVIKDNCTRGTLASLYSAISNKV